MAKNIAASRQKKPGGLSDKVSDIVLVVICAAVMLIVAYPLYYVLVASFSDPYDVYAGKTFLLPSQFTLKGYQAVFADSALFSGFMNSIKYTVIGTIYSVVMIYLVAYPLSVKDLPGRKYISLFFVITMYFGGGVVPFFLLIKDLGLYGNRFAVVIALAFNAFNMIILRNFFESLPPDLEEAAMLDGASPFRIFWQIDLPLMKPALATVTLYFIVDRWNEWFWSNLLFLDSKMWPMQLELRQILWTSSALAADVPAELGRRTYADGMKAAAVIVTMLPIMCVYPFLQKYFAKGVMIGAIKS